MLNLLKNFTGAAIALLCCLCLTVKAQQPEVAPIQPQDSALGKPITHDTIHSVRPARARFFRAMSKATLMFKVSKRGYIIPLPLIAYTPETSLSLGFSGTYLFHFKNNDDHTNLSNATLLGIITLKTQYIVSGKWMLFVGKDQFRLSGDFTYKSFPDKFFGIGNNNVSSNSENYTAQYLQFRPKFSARVAPHFFIGLQYRLEYSFNMHTLQPGLLDSTSVPGGHGYFASGIGMTIDYDSRDNAQFPFKGTYISLSNYWYNAAFGGNQAFHNIKLDARQFVNPRNGHHVIGFQGYAEFNIGTVPFRMMPDFGGYNIMRGYLRGFYRNNNMLAVQAEYRFPIWWKFRGVAFCSTGDVFDHASDLSWKLLKVSGGAGLRFTLDPKERVNLRLDGAIGRFNQYAIYFGLSEVF